MLRFVVPCSLWLTLAASGVSAADPIKFARMPDISPDGKQVAFSYLGDIWVADVAGGPARHLTMHEKHDISPLFSPDGKWIAFSSNRHGTYDVFVVPVRGGRPTRLTFDSADDIATDWSPDSQTLLFTSGRYAEFPSRQEMYTVAATGGMPRKISAFEGREGVFSPKGDMIAYVRGPGTWYRKGYRGSSNDDIWICNADGTNNRQITKFVGQDNGVMWSYDGRALYYVSETAGSPANIVKQELAADFSGTAKSPAQPLTVQKEDSVRRARINATGEWIVYECGPDVCLVNTKTKANRTLQLEVYADDKTNLEKTSTFTSGASEFSLSPDEKHLTVVVQGEIFLLKRTGGKAKRLTENPAFDHGVAWSPDGKSLLFLSDRSGHEDIYALESDDAEHKELLKAHRFKVKQLTKTAEPELGVSFTTDGKRVTFLRGGVLYGMNPDGGDEKVLLRDGQVIDYEWSPDGKWLVYSRLDDHFASELFIVPAGGPTAKDPARNVTRFATWNAGVTWSKTGDRLAFISQRSNNKMSAYVLSLLRPAVPGSTEPKGASFDWEGIHLRVKQPTSMTATQCAISADGTRIAFRGGQDGDDLWVASSDGGSLTRLTTGNTKPTQIQWSRLFGNMIYFRDGSGNVRTVTIGGATTAPSTIAFQARMTVRQDDLYAEMFEQSWRFLNENFYDPAFHGADWNKVREKYRPMVKHCVHREDLYALVSLMLGELNASHLGISGKTAGPEQQTADLGLIFDPAYKGSGLKIAEVLRGGPADRRGITLNVGDVVVAIDREELDGKNDPASILNDRVGEVVELTVTPNPADPKSRRSVEIQAVSRSTITNLQYERWVKKNFDRVTELSKGKLGYIHIPSMDDAGLDRFVRALYSDCFDKEGIVLDVRYNGGGFTHEQVLNYIGGKEHTFFHHRHGGSGLALNRGDRRWTKPLTLLINNRSYSDAEIFPHAFRTLGLGKLVGQPTGGLVIGTRGVTLIDGSTFRTPRIGVTTNKGVNMEKEGVAPDVLVEPHPDEMARGLDPQLDRAVQVLSQDVAAWKKTRPPVAARPFPDPTHPGAGLTPGTTPSPMPMLPREGGKE